MKGNYDTIKCEVPCNIVLLKDKFLSLVKQPTAKEIITAVMKKLEILSRNFSLFS